MDDETAIDYVAAALAYLAYTEPSLRLGQSYESLTDAVNAHFKTELPIDAISAAVTVLSGFGILHTLDSRFVDPVINFSSEYDKRLAAWRFDGGSWAATVLDRYMDGPEDWMGEALRSPRLLDELQIQLTPVDDSDAASSLEISPRVLLSETDHVTLVEGLDRAIQQIGSVKATNVEIAQARALLTAARALADAPEPPAGLIWDLLNRANQIAGIASLVVALIALFASH